MTDDEKAKKDDEEYEATAKALDKAIEAGDDLVETMQGLEKAEISDENDESDKDSENDSEDDSDNKSEDESDNESDNESEDDSEDESEEDDSEPENTELSATKALLEQTQQLLASTQKSQKDTKAWGTKMAQRLKALEKEAKEKPENRPEILDEIDGLEDAIRFMTAKEEDDDLDDLDFEETPSWVDQVSTAIPDMNELLNDPILATTVNAKRSELGEQWNDPQTAIRELNALRNAYLSQKSEADAQARIDKAVDAALKADKKARKKKSGMKVPGGKGGEANTKKAPDYLNDAAAIENLSDDDFDAMTRRAKGY